MLAEMKSCWSAIWKLRSSAFSSRRAITAADFRRLQVLGQDGELVAPQPEDFSSLVLMVPLKVSVSRIQVDRTRETSTSRPSPMS